MLGEEIFFPRCIRHLPEPKIWVPPSIPKVSMGDVPGHCMSQPLGNIFFFNPLFESTGASCEKTRFNIKLRWGCNPMGPSTRLQGPRPHPDMSWDFGHIFQRTFWVPPGSGGPGDTVLLPSKDGIAGPCGSAPYYGLALTPLIFSWVFFSFSFQEP